MITVNVVSETKLYGIKGEGVDAAFLDCVKLLELSNEIKVVINGEGKGDLMHSHTYGPYYFLRGLNYKGKRVFTAHVMPDLIKGTIPMWNVLMPFVTWYLKKVYSYADVCIAISPIVEKAIKELGVKTKVVRIDNPILTEEWRRTPELRKKGREILGLKENDFCVLSVGQVEHRKGVIDFLNMGKQIPNAQFRWVGGAPFGFLMDGISEINKQKQHAASNIKFAGMFSHDEMPALYAAGDLFVFPSYEETFGLSPLEAAASGMPVIYRNLEVYETLYKHDYIKVTTNEQFIETIKKLIDNKDEYEKGVQLSKNLISQFDSKEVLNKLIEIYKSLLIK